MIKRNKTYYILLTLLWLISGCSFDSGRVRLLNWNWFGTPDAVTVQKGDTLYSISRRYNVPLRDLIEINHLTPPYTLNIGRVLRLPTAKFHIVEKGDTLYSISRRYSVDVTTLSRVNNLQAPYTLAIGQRLALPGSVSNETRVTNTSETAKKSSSFSFWKKSSSTTKTTSKKTTTSTKKYTPKKVTTYRKSKFAWPLKGKIISPYGTIGKGRNNDGINIKAAKGTTVKAADAGVVAYAGNELKGFGNLILIKHNDGWVTAYAHNDTIKVRKGQKVSKGTPIATVGTTGGVTTPQLHFETRAGKKALNPLAYLN